MSKPKFRIELLVTTSIVALAAFGGPVNADGPSPGMWRAWLDSPGGELPFGMELKSDAGSYSAWLINGAERVAVPRTTVSAGTVTLDIDYYDARVSATVSSDGESMTGAWVKTGSGGAPVRMAFHARHGALPRFERLPISAPAVAKEQYDVSGHWRIRFSKSDDPAIGVFKRGADPNVNGTVLTTTGDYRYLAGSFENGRLRLSCFDGAHAFLIDARMQPDGSLAGDFWSRDAWHETWTAERDSEASLPDAFGLTTWTGSVPLDALAFPDVNGERVSLADARFAGKARIIEIFGTWCPNCHDASEYLVELHRRYADRGLSIVGLAFELTGDFSRDARQVRKYVERLGIPYTVLVAGVSDKDKAAAAFPALDRIRGYPTTIFLDANGRVRAVHTGFSGPATGDAHQALRRDFERIIEETLADAHSGR